VDSKLIAGLFELETRFNYIFLDKQLLMQALTHPVSNPARNYEPLEFLGDSILAASVSVMVFEKVATSDEGLLTKFKGYLVSKDCLEKIASGLELGRFIQLVNASGGDLILSPRVIVDVFEALVGAAFLDSSFESVHQILTKHFKDHFPSITDLINYDPKSALQEFCHSKGWSNPKYTVISTEGPEHNTTFFVTVELSEGSVFEGKGPSKKDAEKAAAALALKSIKDS
jgi:ribonuclease-3